MPTPQLEVSSANSETAWRKKLAALIEECPTAEAAIDAARLGNAVLQRFHPLGAKIVTIEELGAPGYRP